jgi:membrane protein DedA with SNARE-associated domain
MGGVGLTYRLAQFDRFFDRRCAHGLIARFVTGLRVFGLAGGASGLRWPGLLFYNATGAVAWSTIFGVVGYALAYSWETLERWVGGTGLVALAAVVVIVIVAVVRSRRQSHQP